MGDDGCNMNDLPKVTSILSSERITKSVAFDMMIRFLSTHNTKYSNSQQSQSQQQQQQNQFGQIYHFWDDLYHLTETLATKSNIENHYDDTDPQQVTLRKLRLAANPVKNEFIDDSITQNNLESSSNNDITNVRDDENIKRDTIDEKKAEKKSNKKEKKKKRKGSERVWNHSNYGCGYPSSAYACPSFTRE